ncbi:hypothetical protein VC83_06804 [Pseudogymnoascus destructans]|uniref:Uncharacterized protein n=1 Tax=Pseudogymnoascus destructans TaxID=655981 RepID=A0A177A5P5_9PEZI|nr:uncharacterized protein VC83_06804 [Pseudogymnoascus destructans]OAF56314.1 hypothetical protein VC83_06804 [Pseudogymnoascus destructans]
MGPSTRLFPGDEELGKRDDDHKVWTKPIAAWHYRRWLLRRNMKRIGLTLLGLIALYYFVKNIPTDLKQPSVRPSYDHSPSRGGGMSRPRPPSPEKTQAAPTSDELEGEKHWYNGPIKFYELATSLYLINGKGITDFNKNVVFAAANLKSAATLLPLACEMARWKRNDVHFALMGRDEIPMKTLGEINRITADCNVQMHDARPDYVAESTDFRMEVSSGAALGHINNYMHPQAVIGADYFGSTPPCLTIELPNDADEFATRFLANSFSWPPGEFPVQESAQQLTLRRRIPHQRLTAEESSIRFFESFWPANRFTSHVLVLSPQVELSPLYYHYLKYALLEYKYSSAAASSLMSHEDLLGISLDLPSTYLNDTTPFTAPPNPASAKAPEANGPSFLWGSPNSNAALYFGDKWTELHTLVSHSLSSASSAPKKRISTSYPSWLEYILTLSNSRGYSMLYPQLTAGDALATVHNELYQPPEEFDKPKSETDTTTDDGNFTADPAQHLSLQHKEFPLAHSSLVNMLPDNQLLAPLHSIPLLTWDGRVVHRIDLGDEAEEFSAKFRRDVGGCKKPVPSKTRLVNVGVENLFCDGGEEDKVPKKATDEATDEADDESVEPTETEESHSTTPAHSHSTETATEGHMDATLEGGIIVGT